MKFNIIRLVALASILVTSAACAAELDVNEALKERFPKLTFDSVTESPVKGVYEVVAKGNVFYFDPVSGHAVFGEMWSAKGVNVTAATRATIQAAKYSKFQVSLSDAIKIGSGPNEVIEITDPDCPYCRKMHAYWAARSDVTRYVFLMPILQLHPAAKGKSDYILSSSDQIAALDEVMSGKYDKAPAPTIPLNADLINKQSALVSASGLSGTPAFYINGTFVNGANIPAIEQHLKKKE